MTTDRPATPPAAPRPAAASPPRATRDDRVRRGLTLADAAREFARHPSPWMIGAVLVAALVTRVALGDWRITDALERIGRSLQENQRLERKLEADTESGRKVVVMLAAFPAVFLGLFYFLNPEGTALLFTTILGQVVLVFVIVIVYAAVRWANRILRLDV